MISDCHFPVTIGNIVIGIDYERKGLSNNYFVQLTLNNYRKILFNFWFYPKGLNIRINFGNKVSAANKAMNIANAVNNPK